MFRLLHRERAVDCIGDNFSYALSHEAALMSCGVTKLSKGFCCPLVATSEVSVMVTTFGLAPTELGMPNILNGFFCVVYNIATDHPSKLG